MSTYYVAPVRIPIEQMFRFVFVYTTGGYRHTWAHNAPDRWMHCKEPVPAGGNDSE